MRSPSPSAAPPSIAHEPDADLSRFDSMLRASNSATATLAEWMRDRIGEPVVMISARRAAGGMSLPDAETMRRLGAHDGTEIAYRRVRLVALGRVLSDARNWYLPARLTAAMKDRLERSDSPFGSVVEPLSPVRETFFTERFWPEAGRREEPDRRMPTCLLRHRALVRDGEGHPICEVDEIYTRNILR